MKRKIRSKGRMDAENRWWVAELLAADCEKNRCEAKKKNGQSIGSVAKVCRICGGKDLKMRSGESWRRRCQGYRV